MKIYVDTPDTMPYKHPYRRNGAAAQKARWPKGFKMEKFEVGKKYRVRSIGDAELFFEIEVVSRTAKTITTEKGRLKIHAYDGSEVCYPEGRYSMAPTVRATGVVN